MTIGTVGDLGLAHVRPERLEDEGEGGVEQLSPELAKFGVLVMFAIR